jgi:hypothetical protein
MGVIEFMLCFVGVLFVCDLVNRYFMKGKR